jgi:hypothetical protein
MPVGSDVCGVQHEPDWSPWGRAERHYRVGQKMTSTDNRRASSGRSASTTLPHPNEFVLRDGGYAGSGPRDRRWRITSVVTGWRLDFIDPGDATATYAGTYGSLDAAEREARSQHGGPAHDKAGGRQRVPRR